MEDRGAFAVTAHIAGKSNQEGRDAMAYELPDLPYPYDALEPYVDEQTMRLHHEKHHGPTSTLH